MEYIYLDKWLSILKIKTDNYIDYDYENIRISFNLDKFWHKENSLINLNYNSNAYIEIYEKNSELLIKQNDFLLIRDLDALYINKEDPFYKISGKFSEKLISLILISIVADYPELIKSLDDKRLEQNYKTEIKSFSIHNIEFTNKSDEEILENIKVFKWHTKEGKKIRRRNGEEDLYQIKESITFHVRIFNFFLSNEYIKTLIPKEQNEEYSDYGWNEKCLGIPYDKLYFDESETKKILNQIDLNKLKKSK